MVPISTPTVIGTSGGYSTESLTRESYVRHYGRKSVTTRGVLTNEHATTEGAGDCRGQRTRTRPVAPTGRFGARFVARSTNLAHLQRARNWPSGSAAEEANIVVVESDTCGANSTNSQSSRWPVATVTPTTSTWRQPQGRGVPVLRAPGAQRRRRGRTRRSRSCSPPPEGLSQPTATSARARSIATARSPTSATGPGSSTAAPSVWSASVPLGVHCVGACGASAWMCSPTTPTPPTPPPPSTSSWNAPTSSRCTRR